MPAALVAALIASSLGHGQPFPTRLDDVVYGTADGEALKLDLALPAGPGPHPLVILLHGGAWRGGSRKELSRGGNFADYGTNGVSLTEALAKSGYVAASVGYRLAPKAKFPAQIQDVTTAIRYLKSNAKAYRLDPARVGVVGFSAGGHLAALVGVAPDVAEFCGPLYPGVSSKVQCVVDFFGPADLTLYTETPGIERSFMVPLLGATSGQHPELYTSASPVTHAGKDSPPFLILHGTTDIVVPIVHSKRLHAKLVESGATSTLVPIRNKGHGWFGDEAVRSYELTTAFLREHLKP